MATATRKSTKSPAKTDSKVKAAAKRVTAKSAAKPAAKKDDTVKIGGNRRGKIVASKPTAKPATPRQSREQDSVTATMVRGKRDWKSREIDTKWMPSSNGGVRFEEESDNGRSPHFMTQEDFAAMGKPKKVRVTVKALA
jgi:hypothetical protein